MGGKALHSALALGAGVLGLAGPVLAGSGQPAPGEGDFTIALAKTAGALAVVLLCLLGLYWLSRKVLPKAGGQRGEGLKVVGRLPLGARKQVVLLKVAGKVLVLGVGPDSINRLATLETPEELASLGAEKKLFSRALKKAAREEETG